MLGQQLSTYALALLRRAVPRCADCPVAACTELFAAAAASAHPRGLHTSARGAPLRASAASTASAAGLWQQSSSAGFGQLRSISTSSAALAKRDYYDVLGVQRTASDGEIKKAYYQLAKKYHPDNNPGDEKAQKKFQEVSQAYDTLKEPKQRAIYDQVGPEGMEQGAGQQQGNPFGGGGFPGGFSWSSSGGFQSGGNPFQSGQNPEDILNELFGSGNPFFRGQQRNQGADMQARISLSFMEAIKGGARTLYVSAPRVSSRQVEINLPPGLDDGEVVQAQGEGMPPPRQGGRPGNLLIQVEVRSHPHFRREGRHIHQDLRLDFVDAILGADISVPLLEGSHMVTVRPGTQAGMRIRIPRQGVPSGSQRPGGDMFLNVIVELPKQVTERQRQLLQEFVEEDKLRDRGKREYSTGS